MAPKKKEQQKMSLGDFLADSGFGGGSWADEVEETYVTGTQALPPSDRDRNRFGGGASSSWQDRGFSVRERSPARIPDKPPYTAHLGNLAYDVTNDAVGEFFEGCDVANVRLIEDRELQRPKGFGYVEFANVEGLMKALDLDGESFQGRTVRIKVADPPRGGDSGRGDSIRELGDWTRKGPLPDLGSARSNRPEGGDRERRPPRDPASFEARPARELTWERRGPLAPIANEGGSGSRENSRPPRSGGEGLGERSESHRGGRRDGAPAWGEGREDRPRPERSERPERAERAPTAAEKDMQWRDRMRPDSGKPNSPDGSAPPSPALSSAAPVQGGRPRLNLQKRTVSEATTPTSGGGDSKASPFGAARPIDIAAKEKVIEEKRQQAIQEKREADEKAKEERRIAKEEAAKAEAEAAAAAEAAEAEAKANAEAAEAAEAAAAAETKADEGDDKANGEKAPVRSREPREPPKPRASDASNWRSASSRGGARGGRGGRGDGPRGPRNDRPPRANGSSGQQSGDGEGAAPGGDDDGWTTVPKKGRQGRV